MGVHNHGWRGHTSSTQLKGPYQKVGVRHPKLRGHREVWKSITRDVGVHNPNASGHGKWWVSITPTQGATLNCKSPSSKLGATPKSGSPSLQFNKTN